MSCSRILPIACCLAATVLFVAPWHPNEATIPGPYAAGGQYFPKLDASIWTFLLAWGADHPDEFYDGPILLPVSHPHIANDPRLTEGIWSIPLFRALPPVVAWGWVLYAGLFFTALASWYAGRILSGSHWGGAASMILFGFGGFRAAHVIHVEGTFIPFLPLAVICCVRFLEDPSRRMAIFFGAMIALTSIEYSYTAVPIWIALPVVCAYGALRRAIPWKRACLPFVVAGLICAVCLAPVALRYFAFFRETGVSRQIGEVNYLSADLLAWCTSPNGSLLNPFGFDSKSHSDARLFPGFIAVILALFGVNALKKRSPELILFAIVGLFLSFGTMRLLFWRIGLPHFPFSTPYELLHDYLVPLKAIRAPARMGVLVHLAIGLAGSLGAARLISFYSHATGRFGGKALIMALLTVAFLESRAEMTSITIMPERARDASYAWIANQPGDFAVVDLPMGSLYEPRDELSEAASLFATLVHGKRTPNGSIATLLPWHESIAAHLAHPWTRNAPVIMRALGIRYAVARNDTAAHDCDAAGFSTVFRSPMGFRVYEVDSPMPVPMNPAEFQERLFDENHGHFSAGADSVSFTIFVPEVIKARAGGAFSKRIFLSNSGADTWCANGAAYGMGPIGDPLIALRTWIETPDGDTPLDMAGKQLIAAGRLTRDLPPGETISVLFRGLAPRVPGRYRASLDLLLSQKGWQSREDAKSCMIELEVLPWWSKEEVSERVDGG